MKAAPHGAAKRSDLYWIGGRLCEAGTGDVRLAPLADAGCYTSARVTNGRALFSSLHCRRLQRDGRLLDLGGPSEESVLRIFSELGRAVFGRATGIVRVDLRRDGGPTGQLFGSTRALGAEPADWRAAIAPLSHPGPGAVPGAKCSASPSHESARRYAREHGLDECLLLDSEECLVEGSRSNLLIVSATGELLDLDFDVDAEGGQLQVVDTRIHKVAGQARYTYDEHDNRVPVRSTSSTSTSGQERTY